MKRFDWSIISGRSLTGYAHGNALFLYDFLIAIGSVHRALIAVQDISRNGAFTYFRLSKTKDTSYLSSLL